MGMCMKKIVITFLLVAMCLSNLSFVQEDEPAEWASDIIEELKNSDFFRNESFNNYQENITRGEFIYLAVRLYEIIEGKKIEVDENIQFIDTDDIYARKGATVKITSGVGNNLFGYNQLLTREQLATLMVNVISLLDVEMNEAEVEKFADDDKISLWAKDAIYKARANNIISGVGNNRVDPKGSASVEVALVITSNILGKYHTNESQVSKHLDEMIDTLTEKILYDIDERLFTVFAFMNYTGYDDENNSAGFHIVREKVRDAIEEKNISLSNDKYFLNKEVKYYYYVKAYQRMGDLPSFRYNNSIPFFLKKLNDLPTALEEFYSKANIHDLYLGLLPEHDVVFNEYKDIVQLPLAKMLIFLKLDTATVPKFTIQVNLQDAYWRGYGLGSDNEFYGKSIITGPSDGPNISNIVHEYLHGITTPILNGNIKSRYLSYSDNKSYTDWKSIVDESFVRALTMLTLDEMYSYSDVLNEDKKGFIMTSYIFNRFEKEYTDYSGSLEMFIVMLIEEFKM